MDDYTDPNQADGGDLGGIDPEALKNAIMARILQSGQQGWSGPSFGGGDLVTPQSQHAVANTAGYAGNLRESDRPYENGPPSGTYITGGESDKIQGADLKTFFPKMTDEQAKALGPQSPHDIFKMLLSQQGQEPELAMKALLLGLREKHQLSQEQNAKEGLALRQSLGETALRIKEMGASDPLLREIEQLGKAHGSLMANSPEAKLLSALMTELVGKYRDKSKGGAAEGSGVTKFSKNGKPITPTEAGSSFPKPSFGSGIDLPTQGGPEFDKMIQEYLSSLGGSQSTGGGRSTYESLMAAEKLKNLGFTFGGGGWMPLR